jgi:hypothetical protein
VGVSVDALSRSATVVGIAALLVPAVAAARPAAKGPDAIVCPAAPQGWSVTKSVLTPQTTADGYGGNYEQVGAGGNAATVTCSYRKSASTQVYVAVSFALPSDPNPLNDFDLGCSRGDVGWNRTDRVYRVSSHDQWALATLVDDRSALGSNEVPAFLSVTRKLLQNAKGYGHSCIVVTKPTEVAQRFFFDIRVGGDNLKTTFWTPATPSRSGIYRIKKIAPAAAKLRVDTNSGTRLLEIRLTRGIDYRLATARATGTARFRVKVTGSGIASCHKGATGTLTISTPIDVQVAVCGQSFSPLVTSLIRFYTS